MKTNFSSGENASLKEGHFALFSYTEKESRRQSPTGPFAGRTNYRKTHDGRKTTAASSESHSFRVARSAIVSSEKVRGALYDDGHGMRKRKDSPPGMLPSRDG